MHYWVVGWQGKTWQGLFRRSRKDVVLLLQCGSVRNKGEKNS